MNKIRSNLSSFSGLVQVPRAHLATRNVLVMEELEGRKLADALRDDWVRHYEGHMVDEGGGGGFEAKERFEGAREGKVYKTGDRGLGYYDDISKVRRLRNAEGPSSSFSLLRPKGGLLATPSSFPVPLRTAPLSFNPPLRPTAPPLRPWMPTSPPWTRAGASRTCVPPS